MTRTFRGGERAAAKALAALVTEVGTDKFRGTTATVGQLLDKWLEAGKWTQRPRTLYENRRKIDGRIRPLLGHIQLDELEPNVIDAAYRGWLEEGLSAATVHKYHCILSAAFRLAVRWAWIDASPLSRSSPPKVALTEFIVPTPSRVSALIKAAQDQHSVLGTAVALAALTGARRGELVALRWSDIDLTNGIVKIARSLTFTGGERYEGPTKTHASREVALDPVAIEVLNRRWIDVIDASNRDQLPEAPDPFVLSFRSNGATPVNPDTLTSGFRAICEAMEIPALDRLREADPMATRAELRPGDRWSYRFHDLRHFSVTTLIAAGVDVRTVASRHGHANAAMTLNRYAHALPHRDREAAALLGAMLALEPS